MKIKKWDVIGESFIAALVACLLITFPAYGADAQTLDRLEKIIQQQQAQIEAQQKALERLQGEVEALKGDSASTAPTPAKEESIDSDIATGGPDKEKAINDAVVAGAGDTVEDSIVAVEALEKGPGDSTAATSATQDSIGSDTAADQADKKKAVDDALVAGESVEGSLVAVKSLEKGPAAIRGLNPEAELILYGQVNKAVLYSNDGDRGNLYLVDNDNSSTRVGILGAIEPNEYYKLGTRIEVEYQTNPSNLVNQEDKRLGDSGFVRRHLDLWLNTKMYGKLSLGWGSTASDGTSEMDLSGTSVVGYSGVGDMAGGQLFYDKRVGELSDTPIREVYSNMDGLGRDERIRYDSPSFGGFTGSTSYIADGGGDLALRYFGELNAFKVAAAVAYADPGSASAFLDNQLAGSVSVLHDSGFNGTLAMGVRDPKEAGRDDASFFYTKFGYRHEWFALGQTALAVDYGRNSDIAVNGDKADTIGLLMVQDIQMWGSEVYLGYRFHKLDRDGVDYDNINAIMSGMRVKF